MNPTTFATALNVVMEGAIKDSDRRTLWTLPTPVYSTDAHGQTTFSASYDVNWSAFVEAGFDVTKTTSPVNSAVAELARFCPDIWESADCLPLADRWTIAERHFLGFCDVAVRTLLAEDNRRSDREWVATVVSDALAATLRFWSAESFEIVHVAPIACVELPPGEGRITDHLVLRPAIQSDRDQFWRVAGTTPLASTGSSVSAARDLADISAVAETRQSLQPGETQPDWQRLHAPFPELLDVLRLLGPGHVRCPAQWQRFSDHGLFLKRFVITTSFGALPNWHVLPSQSVVVRDHTFVSRLYRQRLDSEQWPETESNGLNLALRRFNATYDRSNDEDRLIDAWIAFEALFLSDTNQELTYRAQMRIARFVGCSPEEREALIHQLKRSYDLRSKVVHGSSAKERRKLEPISERVAETLAILRQAIAKWLDPSTTRTPKALDQALMG